MEVETTEAPSEHQALIDAARERYSEAVSADDENRQAALDDLKFLAGEQWPASVKQEREAADRPCLTINRLPTFLAQVEGDIRLNRPSIKVRPVENADDATAEVFEGIIRSIEDRSDAMSVYASAGVNAAACGMGHFRLLLEEPDDETFETELRVRRIANPFSVIWDPVATHPTKADARYCFVTDKIPREEFKAKYPEKAEDSYYTEHDADDDWSDPDVLTIAEYWQVERVERVLVEVPDEAQGYRTLSLTPEERAMLPVDPVRERVVRVPRVTVTVMSGQDVLEGPHEWPGKRIPIFPVWGREVHIGDRIVRAGLVRYAKDSQRLFNYMRSASAEMIGLAPKAPWIVTDKMVAGREGEWDRSNVENRAYLTYTPDPKQPGGPQRSAPPPVQSALLQESALASDDMKSTTGIYDAALGARSNETSGVAIRQRQQEADVGSYVFQDNLNRAVRACGEEMVRIIPLIYPAERQVRILGMDQKAKVVEVNGPGGVDLARGKYDVSISTGPGFSTRRQEAAQLFTDLISRNPQGMQLFGDIWAQALDVPGADELEKRLKAMLPPNLRGEDGQSPQEMQAQQMQAQMQAMQMQMTLQSMQLDLAKRQAEIAKIESETAENYSGIELERLKMQAEAIENALRMMAAQYPPSAVTVAA